MPLREETPTLLRFRPHTRLGVGASGLTTRAEDRLTGIDVALKLSPASGAAAREAVQAEAAWLRRLAHPHLPRFVDAGLAATTSGDVAFLATRFVEGVQLGEGVLRQQLTSRAVVDALGDVVRALSTLHAEDLVHGDVKPENVVVSEVGAVLVDLGAARRVGGADVRPAGTPAFAAPERGRGTVSTSLDVYGLGATTRALLDALPDRRAPGLRALRALAESSCAPTARARPPLAAWMDALGVEAPRDAARRAARFAPALGRFVGRGALLGALARLVQEPSGHGHGVVELVGPEGAGKGRLLQELPFHLDARTEVLGVAGDAGLLDRALAIALGMDGPARSRDLLRALGPDAPPRASARRLVVLVTDADELGERERRHLLLAALLLRRRGDGPPAFVVAWTTRAPLVEGSARLDVDGLDEDDVTRWLDGVADVSTARRLAKRHAGLPGGILGALRGEAPAAATPPAATELPTHQAAEEAREALAFDRPSRAMTVVARALLATRGDPPRRARLRALGAIATARLGTPPAERRLARAVEARGLPPPLRDELRHELALVCLRRGAPARTLEILDTIARQAEEGDAAAATRAQDVVATRATALALLGRLDEASAVLAASTGEARGPTDLHDPREPARGRVRRASARGFVALRSDRLEEARAAYTVAFDAALDEGLDFLAASASLNLGVVAHRLGDVAHAYAAYGSGAALADALGAPDLVARLTFNQARLALDAGAPVTAARLAADARAAAVGARSSFLEAAALAVDGEAALSAGDPARARASLVAARATFGRLGASRELVETALALARVDLVEGRLEDARAHLEAARSALPARDEGAAGLDDLGRRVALVEARAALGAGDLGAAVRYAERAASGGDGALPDAARAEAERTLEDALERSQAPALASDARGRAERLEERARLGLPPALAAERIARAAPGALDAGSRVGTAPRGAPGDTEVERLRAVVALGRRLAGAATTREVLDAALDAAVEWTGAERGFVLLAGDEGLRVAAARNMDRERVGRADTKFSRALAARVVDRGDPILTSDAAADARLVGSRSVLALGLKSVLCVPVREGDRVTGALYVDNRHRRAGFDDGSVELALALADHVGLALARARLTDDLAARNAELSAAKAELERVARAQAVALAATGSARTGPRGDGDAARRFPALASDSPAMHRVLAVLARVASTDASVLVRGESGTGKEVTARAVHDASSRARGPFVAIDCASLPEGLLEAELFGHVKGAFTGAEKDRPGLFVSARGGTLFLDELGELPLALQAKLLRALQEREVRPVGATKPVKVDVRLVCATNRDLRMEIARGGFREDLYFRVAVVEVELPPLRDRLEDLPRLAATLVARVTARAGASAPPRTLGEGALRRLAMHDFRGNVRELENLLTKAYLFADGATIGEGDVEAALATAAGGNALRAHDEGRAARAREDEAERVAAMLRATGWNVVEAARRLGIPRATFYRRLDALGLRRPRVSAAARGGSGTR